MQQSLAGGGRLTSIKEFIEAMTASWPAALAAFIGSAGLLFSDHLGVRYLATLPAWALGVALVVAWFSAGILFVALVRWLLDLVGRPFRRRRKARAKAEHVEGLAGLPDEEKYILAWAGHRNTQVFLAEFNHELLEPLVAKGYVSIVPGHHSILAWPHRIPDHIWKEVRAGVAAHPSKQELRDPF